MSRINVRTSLPAFMPCHCLVVNVLQGLAQPGQLGIDAIGAGDRREVAGDQQLGLQFTDPLDRCDRGQRVAVAVAAHGHQIGDVSEDRSEGVPAQADSLVRQPQHQRVVGFPARHRDQLDAPTTDVERQGVLEVEVDGRNALSRQALGAESTLDGLNAGSPGCA